MKKTVLVAVLLVLLFTQSVSASTNFSIKIGDQPISFAEGMGSPFIDNQSRTMIPIRAVSEGLGHSVSWDAATQTATIDGAVKIRIGDFTVQTASGAIQMDTQAVVINGRTYVPLRFVGQALGYEIAYEGPRATNQYHHTINIYGGNGAVQPPIDGDIPVQTGERQVGFNSDGLGITTTGSGRIDIAMISSLLNPGIGHRQSGSTLNEDVETLNSIMDIIYNLKPSTGGGEYQFTEVPRGNDQFAVWRLTRDSQGRPHLMVTGWPMNETEETMERFILSMNGLIETLKFYSKSMEDGESIYSWIDGYAKRDQPFPLGERTFGNTRVSFDTISRGFSITFLN